MPLKTAEAEIILYKLFRNLWTSVMEIQQKPQNLSAVLQPTQSGKSETSETIQPTV
jgi:hypothetical protein